MDIHKEISDIIGNNGLDRSNIIDLTVKLMQMVEEYTTMTGPEKKQLVLDSIENFVETHEGFSDNEKRNIVWLIRFILPSVIDMLINVDKKELQIKMSKILDFTPNCTGCSAQKDCSAGCSGCKACDCKGCAPFCIPWC